MGQEIRVWVAATPAKEKLLNLPEEWDEMDEDDRADYLDDLAHTFLHQTVKFGTEVVSD